MLRRLVARWSRRVTQKVREGRSEAGETLVEVLLALIILALASVALITAFETSINASAEHRDLANFNSVLASSIATTTSLVQQDSNGVFSNCQPLSGYPSGAQITSALGLTGYTAAIAPSGSQPAVEYSLNGSYSTACSSDDVSNPQLINVVVTNTATGRTQSDTVVVDDPVVIQTTGVSGTTANELVFVTQPEGATVGTDFDTQPVLEVQDCQPAVPPALPVCSIVTSDLSPITLSVGAGPAGASLSNTCSGEETAGIVTYTGCSLDVVGTGYQLYASEPDPSGTGNLTSSSAPFTVYASQLDTPNVTVIPSTKTPGAINVSYTDPPNAPVGQLYSMKRCSDSAMSQNCVITNNPVSGADITGLTPGSTWYIQITALASGNYLGSTSPPAGPTMATVQLTAPPSGPTLGFGPMSGSLTVVSFTGSANAGPGVTYTAKACTNGAMNSGCVSNTNITPNGTITGLGVGVTYNVEIIANASPGYLMSLPSPLSSQVTTKAVNTPTNLSATPSTSQQGVILVTFTEPGGGPSVASYTVTACSDAAMSMNCVPIANFTSGGQVSGLNPGTDYYLTVTAVSTTTGVASATSADSPPTLATLQLTAPTNVVVGYGATAGSVSISATPSNGPANQTYTALACTNSNMTGCIAAVNPYTLGNDITGLSASPGAAGTTYYVQITANASPGYLASSPSVTANHDDTGLIGAVTNITPTPSHDEITVTFSAPTGTAPPLSNSSYTIVICTNENLVTGALSGTCFTHTGVGSGNQFTGLTTGQRYYVQVTSIAPVGYVNNSAETTSRVTVT